MTRVEAGNCVFDRAAALAAEAARCRALWCGVLQATLEEGLNSRDPRERDRLMSWVRSRDGREVCDLAGLDYDAFRMRMNVLAETAASFRGPLHNVEAGR